MAEIKQDSGSKPSFFDSRQKAFIMENMATFNLNARTISKPFNKADVAVAVFVLAIQLLNLLGCTFFSQARKTFFFIDEPITTMPTFEDFRTCAFLFTMTLLSITDIIKCLDTVGTCVSKGQR